MGDLTALLLDAKNEYRLQLEEIVTPSIVGSFASLWTDSVRDGGTRDGVLVFQTRLREIPAWNASVISNKTREIQYVYPYLDDLIAACIVAQLKIMSSIKLSQEKPRVELKLPKTETFVHELYIYSAKRLYENPLVMESNQSYQSILEPIVADAIERTIRKVIPFKDVLSAYLQPQQNVAAYDSDSSGGSFPKRDSTPREEPEREVSVSSESEEEEEEIRVGGGPPGDMVSPAPISPPMASDPEYAAPLLMDQPPAAAYHPQSHPSPPPHAPLQPQVQHPPSSPPPPPPPPPPPQVQGSQLFAGDQGIRQGF